MSSLEDYLRPVAPHLCPQLISTGGFRGISSITRLLPGRLAFGMLGFECRLGYGAPEADFLVCATAASGGRDSLLRLASERPNWEHIRAFADTWSNASSPLHERADRIWLEFDVGSRSSNSAVPSVFFAPRTPQHADTTDDLSIAAMGLSLLMGGHLPPALLMQLNNCFSALPSSAMVFQVGAMVSRESKAVRLCVYGLSPEEILDYLLRVRWKGPAGALQITLATLSSLVDFFCLDMDVSQSGIQSSIGLECYCAKPGQRLHDTKWRPLLDHLVETSLCTAPKRDTLIGFPGYSYMRKDGELWPEDLRQASLLLESQFTSLLIKSLHHIKVTLRPAQSPEAKAYLAVWHEWLNRS